MGWWNDKRNNCGNYFEKFNADKMTAIYLMSNDNEDEIEMPCIMEWGICSVCNGNGTYVIPGIDDEGLSYDDFDEDPQFEEDYFSGSYNETCNQCEGRTSEPVLSEHTKEYKSIIEHIRQREEDDYCDRQTMAAEMGWR